MKTLKNLVETLKELISEATQNRSASQNMRLIPIPASNRERKLPNPNNPR